MVKFPQVLKVRGRGQTNKFGYKPRDPIGPQLCRVLGLSNSQELCRKIENNLITTSRRYLDIDTPFSDQPRAKLILMHDEVIRKYPDLFSGENNVKKLFFAIRFILKEHHSRRSMSLGSNIRSVQSTQSASAGAEGEVLDLTLDESDSEKENMDGSVGGLTPKKSRNKRNIIAISPSQSPNKGANQGNEIQSIREFLSTCVPPMGRFLKHFLDFGCSNEQFLRGLSEWTPEAKEKLLRKVLGGPEGHGASEMELAVIQNQLESYFMNG